MTNVMSYIVFIGLIRLDKREEFLIIKASADQAKMSSKYVTILMHCKLIIPQFLVTKRSQTKDSKVFKQYPQHNTEANQ